MGINGRNKFLLGKLVAVGIALATGAALSAPALAGSFNLGDALNYGVLYEGNGGKDLSFNNSTETGNFGIGGTGTFQGNGPGTITGSINFSAADTGQFSNSGLTITGGTPAGTPNYNVSDVTSSLNAANSASQALGLETGTTTTITSGGSVTASSGTPDGSGNYVFTVTNISFSSGTFTVNGGASDYVILNVAGGVGSNGLNGTIALSGGITWDHVLINYTPVPGTGSVLTAYNNDYATLTGGPTMTISTNGLTTTGIFASSANFPINHTGTITGSIIGGDTQNSSFVSGANLSVPNVETTVPLPAALWSGLSMLGMLAVAAKYRSGKRA